MSQDRDRAIELLKTHAFPIRLGTSAVIVEREGRYQLRACEPATPASAASERPRTVSWMPDHYYRTRTDGPLLAEAETADALAVAMMAIDWPADWHPV